MLRGEHRKAPRFPPKAPDAGGGGWGGGGGAARGQQLALGVWRRLSLVFRLLGRVAGGGISPRLGSRHTTQSITYSTTEITRDIFGCVFITSVS